MNELDNLFKEKGMIITRLEYLQNELKSVNQKIFEEINKREKEKKEEMNKNDKEG